MQETNQYDALEEEGSEGVYQYRVCVFDDNAHLISETSSEDHSFDSAEENALSKDPPLHEDESSLELIEGSDAPVGTYTIQWVRSCESPTAESVGDPPVQSRKQCPECKGAGNVVLLISRSACKLCGGSGFVSG